MISRFKKAINLISVLCLTICAILANMVPVYAETETQDPILKVNVSSEITLEDNDIFTLTLKNQQGQTANLEIKAMECYSEPKEYTFGEGTYEIADLVYQGSNPEISNGYYGVKKTVNMTKGNEERVVIMVGPVQITTMEPESLLIKKAGTVIPKIDVNEVGTEEEKPSATTITEPETTGIDHPEAASTATEEGTTQSASPETNTEANAESTTLSNTGTETGSEKKAEDPDEKDVVEEVNDKKENKKKKGSLFLKGLPIFILAIAGFGAIFVISRRRA